MIWCILLLCLRRLRVELVLNLQYSRSNFVQIIIGTRLLKSAPQVIILVVGSTEPVSAYINQTHMSQLHKVHILLTQDFLVGNDPDSTVFTNEVCLKLDSLLRYNLHGR